MHAAELTWNQQYTQPPLPPIHFTKPNACLLLIPKVPLLSILRRRLRRLHISLNIRNPSPDVPYKNFNYTTKAYSFNSNHTAARTKPVNSYQVIIIQSPSMTFYSKSPFPFTFLACTSLFLCVPIPFCHCYFHIQYWYYLSVWMYFMFLFVVRGKGGIFFCERHLLSPPQVMTSLQVVVFGLWALY